MVSNISDLGKALQLALNLPTVVVVVVVVVVFVAAGLETKTLHNGECMTSKLPTLWLRADEVSGILVTTIHVAAEGF
jgi:hypothetical protein